MNSNQRRIDEYFPTQFQRARDRMVARYNRSDVPQDAIDLIQSYATYEPLTFKEFFYRSDNYLSIVGLNRNEIERAYEEYVRDFNNNPIPSNRENYRLKFLHNWLITNYSL